jgi:hypothetical protein
MIAAADAFTLTGAILAVGPATIRRRYYRSPRRVHGDLKRWGATTPSGR